MSASIFLLSAVQAASGRQALAEVLLCYPGSHRRRLSGRMDRSSFGVLKWPQSLSRRLRTRTRNKHTCRLLDHLLLYIHITEARGAHLPGSARSAPPRSSPASGRRYAHVALLSAAASCMSRAEVIRALRACPGNRPRPRTPSNHKV